MWQIITETSVTNYQATVHKIPEVRKSGRYTLRDTDNVKYMWYLQDVLHFNWDFHAHVLYLQNVK